MTRPRRFISVFTGLTVVAIMLAWIGYALRELLGTPIPPKITIVEDPIRLRNRNGRFGYITQIPLAAIPWGRDVNAPLRITLNTAVEPWQRDAARPDAVLLATALVPTLPVRHDPLNPAALNTIPADLPWIRSAAVPAAGLSLPLADMPALPTRFDPLQPEPASLEPAAIPLLPTRYDPTSPQPATVEPAATPWITAALAQPDLQLDIAAIPSLPLRHDPHEPNPSDLTLASLPWTLDISPQTPACAEVPLARVPNRLNALNGPNSPRHRHTNPGE